MRVLIIGGSGQLGTELQQHWSHHELLVPDSSTINIGDPATISLVQELEPELVLLSGAYTNVDGCTLDPERAFRINTLGPKYVALACGRLDIPLVYISTNEVFDGQATQPYGEYDQPAPINVYGRSKWGGEQAVMQHATTWYIVRVAWLYGGPRNFIRTMLRLGEESLASGKPLRVVQDETGSPTYAYDVAQALRQLVDQGVPGIYHLVNEGFCSRYDLAQAALAVAGIDTPIEPISLADFQRPSTPPPWSPLHNRAAAGLGIQLRPWQAAVDEFVHKVLQES